MSDLDGFLLTCCPICESRRLQHVFISHGYQVCRCQDCSFMFLKQQPSDEVLEEIYNEEYFLGAQTPEGEKAVSDMKRATAKLYLNQLVEYCGSTRGKLLEIGCGSGDFLTLAKETGFDVTGIEISRHAVDTANRQLGDEHVRCGTLETVLPGEQFDYCTLFDTIEHTRNPLRLLRKIHETLKPGGILFLSTPSLDSWSAKLMKQNWMEFKTEHLHYFDTRTIQDALTKAGFGGISVAPNYKYLTLDYICNHFKRFKVPFFTRCISMASVFLPDTVRSHQFKIIASSINVLCRSNQIRE